MCRCRLYIVVAASILLLNVFFALPAGSVAPSPEPEWRLDRRALPREAAANDTLGFSAILALSTGPSWRSSGLQAAAALTGLDIITPIQPPISNDVLQTFKNLGAQDSGALKPSAGSAKAWLAHLDLLKFVVSSGFQTALVIEDDVDWDVNVRAQMQLVSDNIRAFTNSTDDDDNPYGRDWDVLWIGHCGEVPRPEIERLEYSDKSLLPTELYAGWSKKHLFHISEGLRAVQYLKQTVCTFGYGVTVTGARHILESLSSGQDEAFDVGLMHRCQQGILQCITINPEIMHHYNPKDGTGYVSQTREGDGKGQSVDESAYHHLKGTTANVKNSARCAALFQEPCPQPPTEIERSQKQMAQ